jgi:hypothetical protein
MAEVVEAYRNPQLDFDTADWDGIVADVEGRIADLESTDLVREVESALGVTLREAEDAPAAAKREPRTRLLAFEGSGFVRATRICAGWTTPPVPDRARNGFIELVVGFTDDHLDPVLFGTFEDCRYLAGGQRVFLTEGRAEQPALAVHVGDAESADDLSSEALTFDVDLRGTVGSDDLRIDFDFRVRPNGEVEFRVPAQGDSLVVVTEGGVPRRIRAKNGEFRCGEGFTCGSTDAGAGN